MTDLNSYDYASALVHPGVSVLDIGAGSGTLAMRLVRQSCSVTAVDIDPDGLDQLDGSGVETLLCDVETTRFLADIGDRRFDTVVLLDVLEHLRDPEAVLRSCVGLLAPGGVVIVSIPNVSHADVRLSLLAGRFRYMSSGLLDRGHLRFFDRNGVEALAKSADLEILESFTVEREPGTTEIALPEGLPGEALEFVTRDPDSRVYQWVLRLAPAGALPPEAPVQLDLLRRCVELNGVLEDATVYARSLEEHRIDSEERLHGADLEIAAMRDELTGLRTDLADRVETHEIDRTRIAALEHELRARALVLDVARQEVDAHRRELESLGVLLAAHRARLEELEPVAAANHAELHAIHERAGYRAMHRLAVIARRSPLLFAIMRGAARLVGGSAQ